MVSLLSTLNIITSDYKSNDLRDATVWFRIQKGSTPNDDNG